MQGKIPSLPRPLRIRTYFAGVYCIFQPIASAVHVQQAGDRDIDTASKHKLTQQGCSAMTRDACENTSGTSKYRDVPLYITFIGFSMCYASNQFIGISINHSSRVPLFPGFTFSYLVALICAIFQHLF